MFQVVVDKMNKIHYLSLLLLLMAALASCSSNDFKIEGNITHLDGGVVRVVFSGDSGVVDMKTEVDDKGHFAFKGVSSQPAVVTLFNKLGEPLVMVIATNGDHLKLKGDAEKALSIKVKGNKLNEDWQLFRKEHAGFYTDPNPSRLDAAIEKYVRENPDDMLSTVLLMVDYSNYDDRDKVDAMLNSINSTARPESLTQAFKDYPKKGKNVLPRMMSLTLVKHKGDFEEIQLTDRISLISFWANPQKDRVMLVNKLQNLDEGVRVIDVLMESDTLRWSQTISADPETWRHYWAPGGPLEQGIQVLGIRTAPWYAVTDSTGLVAYTGSSLDAAVAKATSLMK